ncbi:hypothetical protein Mal52_37100 [Symmachiella dynata]|uniref:Uncharacterized protein n=1 Tax=Symmachiella dynata TaxID=2527995 RepID=A0A517ZRV7_9PLAN|nr:hypothetical protein [Symmachiella dynata]QDU45219.1 hypothetical protein Mal52_37100 [Symmachiella dynata]
MPSFKCAHVREQGVDLVIAPVNSSFGRKSDTDQQETIDAMQLAAKSAGLAGTVVPIWNIGNRTVFIAPPNWHPFFKSISWNDVLASVNKEISW